MVAKGLKTRKKQRLFIISSGLAAVFGAVALILFALGGDSLSLFVQPSDLKSKQYAAGQNFRLGGLVKDGSYALGSDGLTHNFVVTDCAADVPVAFKGLLPDLFREGQGVVLEGTMNTVGDFKADTVLAKHDENYAAPGTMPANADACTHPEDSLAEDMPVTGK